MGKWDEVVGIFNEAKRWVAFTGAGISAESGIPTYRGSGEASLWSKYDSDKYARIDSFMNDPMYYWSFFRDERYPQLKSSPPNNAHHVLAHWEKLGKLKCVITQNIDGLHRMAGSKDVIELHGNAQRIYCMECNAQYTPEEVYRRLQERMPPDCKTCGGRLRPDVVFFGEMLPQGALERAYQEAQGCDLMLSVGSSLVVYPAADIPYQARNSGAKLVIVNRDPTPLDAIAAAKISDPAGEFLPQLSEALKLNDEF